MVADGLQGAGRWGRAGVALLALHVLLLCLPPLPPDLDGSLWSYLAGYTAVALLLRSFHECQAVWAARWAGAGAGRRWALGLAAAAGSLLAALALRAAAPASYLRFAEESGLFEPLTLGCYVAGALLLLGAARARAGDAARHLRLLSGGFALLALEEIDWLGLWGGLFGSPGGVYAGALHDVIALAAAGALPPLAAALIAAGLVAGALLLWWRGLLQPRAWAAMARAPDAAWVAIAAALLLVAAAIDAHLVAWLGRPSLEEALELPAAICLLAWAFERSRCTPRESSEG